MTDFLIPCETVARLSNVLCDFPERANGWFRTIRIENGCAIASNRTVMVIEKIPIVKGVFHLTLSPALVDQCRTEAPFKSMLTITMVDALNFATAKTTLGYIASENCAYKSSELNELDNWKTKIADLKKPHEISYGGMCWAGSQISRMASASPSGMVVFEQNIDVRGPAMLRDIYDPDWCGFFQPWIADADNIPAAPATMPDWLAVQL